MSTSTHKAIVRRFVDQVWNQGRLDLLEEFFAPDVILHGAPPAAELSGRGPLEAALGQALKVAPDIRLTLHDVIAEGSKVVTRWSMTATHRGEWMGIPATGKQLTQSGAAIYRLADARIAEIWDFPDNLGLMQQLGLVPAPDADRPA